MIVVWWGCFRRSGAFVAVASSTDKVRRSGFLQVKTSVTETTPEIHGHHQAADGRLKRAVAWFSGSGRRAQADDPVLAILFVTLSMASLAGIAAIVRKLSMMGMDSQVAFFWRNFFCLVWMLPLLAARGRSLFNTTQPQLYIVRVALSFISVSAFFYALAKIPIGEATAISFLSPLFGTLFAIFLLGEVMRLRRWSALIAGFAGAMIMLQPWSAGSSVGGADGGLGSGQMAALISAICIGIIGPLVKQLTSEDDADRIVFITAALMTPLSLVPALFFWSWPTGVQWLMLIALGLFTVLGHMTLVRGYVATDASLVMTFKFSRLPFAVALGFVFFGETIAVTTWIGAAVIFAAGVYIARREAEARRAAKVGGRGVH